MTTSTDAGAPIGGGANEDIVALTAREDLPETPLGAADEPLRFANSVLSYAQRWLGVRDRRGEQTDGFAVFVLSERPRQDPQLMEGAEPVRGFRRADQIGRRRSAGRHLVRARAQDRSMERTVGMVHPLPHQGRDARL
jgi:hypothetical protein